MCADPRRGKSPMYVAPDQLKLGVVPTRQCVRHAARSNSTAEDVSPGVAIFRSVDRRRSHYRRRTSQPARPLATGSTRQRTRPMVL
jgi:hypothetical protein